MSMKIRPPRSRREWTQPDKRDRLPDVRRAQFIAMMRAFHELNSDYSTMPRWKRAENLA